MLNKLLKRNFTKNINALILGAGNGAHIMASIMGSKPSITTNLCSTLKPEIKILKEKTKKSPFGIKIKNSDGSKSQIGKISKITSDLSKVVPEADIILLCVPAIYQEKYIKNLKPFLNKKKKIILGAFPGATNFEIMTKKILGDQINFVTIFSGNTLPWACRINEFGREVQLMGVKETMAIGCVPFSETAYVCEVLQRCLGKSRIEGFCEIGSFPAFEKTGVLGISLQNINGLLHPPILCGNMHFLERGEILKHDEYYFYQGVGDYTEDLLNRVWNELLEIKNIIKNKYPEQNFDKCVHIYDWYKITYPHTIKDNSSLKSCTNTNLAYKGLKYPLKKVKGGFLPDENHRYFQEDLPTGIVAVKGIADLVGIETPAMDEVIYWAQRLMGKEYVVDGKLTGRDLGESRAPQRYGISSLEDFMSFYD